MALKTVTLEVDPNSRRARRSQKPFSAGWDCQQRREWREAIGHYTRALEIDRTLFSALANRGMCWHQLGKPDEALADYAAAMKVGTPELRNLIRVNRGVLYQSVRRYDEALADFATDPSWESQCNASYIHLMRGDFERGLAMYRSRPPVQQWKAPLHKLADLAGKDVLILHEQGFGDSIMMSRFVPKIQEVARTLHWLTRTALMPLLTDNFPNVEFSDGNDVSAAALIYRKDVFLLVMDLWQTTGI